MPQAHTVWLRCGLEDGSEIPAIWPTDYLHIASEQLSLSGIVMRQHIEPWRIDIVCHRVEADASSAAFKSLLPLQTKIQVKKITWPSPTIIKSTVLFANDDDGLAAVSLNYAWQAYLPSQLLLWKTRGASPFSLAPSQIYTPELPADMIATMLEFEAMHVVLRILSNTDRPGCFHGDAAALLDLYPNLNAREILTMKDLYP